MTAIRQTGEHVLYRFFHADGSLLYIGITNSPGERFRTHSKLKPWWSEVARITMDKYPNRAAARMAETAAIEVENPRHNIVGKVAVVEPLLAGEEFASTLHSSWDHDTLGSIFSAFPITMRDEPAVLVMCPNQAPVPLTFVFKLRSILEDHADEAGAQVWLDTRTDNYKTRDLLSRSFCQRRLVWQPYTTHQQRAIVTDLRVGITPRLFADLDMLDPDLAVAA